jgi:hypothetical protein
MQGAVATADGFAFRISLPHEALFGEGETVATLWAPKVIDRKADTQLFPRSGDAPGVFPCKPLGQFGIRLVPGFASIWGFGPPGDAAPGGPRFFGIEPGAH